MLDIEKRRKTQRESAARSRAKPEHREATRLKRAAERADPVRGAIIRANKKAWRARNLERVRAQAKARRNRPDWPEQRAAWARKNPEVAILAKVRSRANHAGIPFALKKEDIIIPEICPVLGVRLIIGGRADNSLSVDRRDNAKGYTPDNICLISMRANRLKSDATLEELELLLAYMRAAA